MVTTISFGFNSKTLAGAGSVTGAAGVAQEWELNYDLPNDVAELFIDGISVGSFGGAFVGVQTPSANPGTIQIGSALGGGAPIDGTYDDIQIFTTVQHTVDFAGEIPRVLPLTVLDLDVDVEGSPFTVTFNTSDFAKPSKATSTEVAQIINDQLTGLLALAKHIDGYKAVGLETTNGNTNYQITGGTINAILGFDTTLQEDPPIILPSASGTQIGSFIFDPDGRLFTVTQQRSTLAATIPSGTISPTIALTDASDFPNQPGQFIINYGRNNQEGPIDYNSRPNNSSLLIDASYVFEREHLSGSVINFVVDQPTIPRVTGVDFAVYITGTEQARIAAQDLIKKLLAAGVVVRFVINFPEFLFECVCRGCDPDESPDHRGTLTGQGPLVF